MMITFIKNQSENIQLINYKNSYLNYEEHTHVQSYCIMYLLSGELTISIDDKVEKIAEETMFVIPPHSKHSLQTKTGYDLIVVNINNQTFEAKNFLFILTLFFEKLVSQGYLKDATSKKILEKLPCIQPIQNKKIVCIKNIDNLIRNPEQTISIDELARASGISRFHYIRKFKQELGLTPHRFQIQNRVRKFQKMIEKKESLTTAAINAGFYDQSHCIKHFEKLLHLSPKQYREYFIQLED